MFLVGAALLLIILNIQMDRQSQSILAHNHEATQQIFGRWIKQLNPTFPKGECLADISVLTFLEPRLSLRYHVHKKY